MSSLLVYNIRKLVTPLARDKNDASRPLQEFEHAAIWIENGVIKEVGNSRVLENKVPAAVERNDANGMLALPGFVDCHTHPVFVGNRSGEFFMRNRGASYLDIAAAGGGIHASAKRIAEASIDQIVRESLPRFESSLSFGVTTIECKSGYGLTWKGEEKLLVALREIEKIVPQHLSKTFLIHMIPQEWQDRRAEFAEQVLQDMIPEVAERRFASCVDVFCEEGAFTVDESRRFLAAAKDEGMSVTIHANQFGHSGGALLAAEIGARSADHLEYLSDEEIVALAEAGVPGVALPACVFYMGTIPYPPMRKMIERGMRLAVATDMNPGTAMTESIPFCMTAAAIYGKLSISELLWSVTFDAARVLGLNDKVGSLETGKSADFTLWEIPNAESLAYYLNGTKPSEVWIAGEQAIENDSNSKRY